MQSKTTALKALVLVTLLIMGLFSLFSAAHAQSLYDLGWGYRNAITVDNSGNPDALTNYQLKVELDGVNFDFSMAKSAGQDIRFTDSDGETLLDYWIESWDDVGENAIIWVKAPSVDAMSSADIYMYYGNSSAEDASDGSATFEFFDDFETDFIGPDGWTPKSPVPEPAADPTTVVYNDKIYLFGGYDRDENCVKSYQDGTFVYDPSTDTWTQLADMPTGRWGPVAVEFDGLIHVFSGEAATGATTVHEVYDPATDTWSTWTSVPSGLGQQGLMGIRYGDKIHLFYRSYHYEYDPVANTYTQRTDVPTPRTWGTCAVVNDSIYIIGGYSYGTPGGATDVNEVYDPATDTWTFKSLMPVKKYGITRENPVIDGKIYCSHGLDGGFHTDLYVYDPSTDTWEQKSNGINPRDGVGCGAVGGKLYVIGGRDLLSCAVGRMYVEEYDPAADMGGGVNPWNVSSSAIIDRDELASYEGDYGFLFDQSSTSGVQTAEHFHDYATCAVDLYWNMTDFYGEADVQPQGVFGLTGSITDGHLYFYNNNGTPEFRWYTGSFTTLQTGAWNTWYPITLIWNGADSKVIIDGSEHLVTASAVNSDRIFFRINKATRYFVDLVRVRNYTPIEPVVTIGPVESVATISLVLVDQLGKCTEVDTVWFEADDYIQGVKGGFFRIGYDDAYITPLTAIKGPDFDPPGNFVLNYLVTADSVLIDFAVLVGTYDGPGMMLGMVFSSIGETTSTPITIDSSLLSDLSSNKLAHSVTNTQIQIDCTPPSAEVSDPESGGEYFEMPELTINFQDNINLDRAFYQIDDCQGEWEEFWSYNSGSSDTTITWTIPDLTFGAHSIYFKTTDEVGYSNQDTCSYSWNFTLGGYYCGDANSDDFVNVSDAVYIINYIFTGGPAPDPLQSGNVNCDIGINVSDAVWIINYVFVGGNAPCDWDGDGIPDC